MYMERQDYYEFLNELVSANRAVWQVTIVWVEGSTPAKPGMKMLIPAQGNEVGNLGGGELEHNVIDWVRSAQPEKTVLRTYNLSAEGGTTLPSDELPTQMICGGRVQLFIEPLGSSKLLQIIGAGHCGRALAHLAGLCGFQTRLIDNRPEILDRIPPEICSDKRHSDFSSLEGVVSFSPSALIVIMTHGHLHDQHVLELCLGQPFRYLGMIGSKRKVESTFAALLKKGHRPEQLEKVHAPIGLPIGSQTPYEIAVSILSQLIAIDYGRQGNQTAK